MHIYLLLKAYILRSGFGSAGRWDSFTGCSFIFHWNAMKVFVLQCLTQMWKLKTYFRCFYRSSLLFYLHPSKIKKKRFVFFSCSEGWLSPLWTHCWATCCPEIEYDAVLYTTVLQRWMEDGRETQTNKHDPTTDANNTPVVIRGDTGPLNRDMRSVRRKRSMGQHNDT